MNQDKRNENFPTLDGNTKTYIPTNDEEGKGHNNKRKKKNQGMVG